MNFCICQICSRTISPQKRSAAGWMRLQITEFDGAKYNRYICSECLKQRVPQEIVDLVKATIDRKAAP